MRVIALEQPRAREKILYTFYYLTYRFGKQITPNTYMIKINLTHQMIADFIGLTRETTAIVLNQIKNDKILSYKRQKYLVNRAKLLQNIGEDSFANIESLR